MNVEALTMTQLKMACAEIARSRLEIIIDSTAAPFSDANPDRDETVNEANHFQAWSEFHNPLLL